ncbi:MAG: hypothetical protein DIU80_013980 [Chloroflexota bacterium]|nr:MAG: hypothetical protein DIU80_16880 [Chloroflexota bacterium]
MNELRSALPMVLLGLLLALALIWIASGGRPGPNQALEARFAPRPRAPGEPTPAPFTLPQVRLPDLPPEVQQAVADAATQLSGGQAAPALTPVARGSRVEIEVAEVRREGQRVRVRGTVANIADQPLEIPPGAFSFRDSAGTNYATSGSGGPSLQPGASTTFDLTLPLPEGLGLTLILTLPPDPPLEQVLFPEVTQ